MFFEVFLLYCRQTLTIGFDNMMEVDANSAGRNSTHKMTLCYELWVGKLDSVYLRLDNGYRCLIS